MNKNLRSAAFKKKIALEALREDQSIEEIAREHGLHRVQACKWKKALLEQSLFFKDHLKESQMMKKQRLSIKLVN